MNAANPILSKLAATLDARADQALANLADLEQQIQATIIEAEARAKAKVQAAESRIEATVGEALSTADHLVSAMVETALAQAVSNLTYRLDAMLGVTQAEFAVIEADGKMEPATTPAPDACVPTTVEALDAEPDYQAWLAYRDDAIAAGEEPLGYIDWLADQTWQTTPSITEEAEAWAALAQAHREQTAEDDDMDPEKTTSLGGDILDPISVPTPSVASVAAQVLTAEPDTVAGFTPEDDEDDEEDEDNCEEAARAIPYTSDTSGLHERRGRGRGCRYVPVDIPEPGETYYRKSGRTWEPVVYGPF